MPGSTSNLSVDEQ
jgi:hypothetical protein